MIYDSQLWKKTILSKAVAPFLNVGAQYGEMPRRISAKIHDEIPGGTLKESLDEFCNESLEKFPKQFQKGFPKEISGEILQRFLEKFHKRISKNILQ